jgi:triacylglycerol lipase
MGSFKSAKQHFTAKGCKVFETEVNAVQTSEFRGKQLAAQIRQILTSSGAAKVNIIAHSQGGLDARYAIAAEGVSAQVASLSTLSTPHLGTPIADQSLQMTGPLAQSAMSVMLNFMGRTMNGQTQDPDTKAAVQSLTVEYMTKTFNAKYPNVPSVYYQSWSAITGNGTQDRMKTMMGISHSLLNSAAGPNDGVVPETSARWGTFRATLHADHLDLIGYKLLDFGGFDHLKFLETTFIELKQKGF